MNRTAWSVALLVVTALPCAAQQKPGPRSFYPTDYNTTAYVNVLELQDNGVWGTVERSPAKMLFEMFRRSFGFDLAEIEHFEFAAKLLGRVPEEGEPPGSVMISLRGTEQVQLADVDLEQLDRYEEVEIGGHTVLAGREPSFVSPSPGLIVMGDSHLIHPILEGAKQGGVASPDLEALIAGPKPLGYFGIVFDERHNFRSIGLPNSWIAPEDHPAQLFAKLAVDEEAATLGMTIEIDFQNGRGGAAKLEASLRHGLEQIGAMPELKFAKELLASIELQSDAKSLRVTADLGAPRKAAGTLTQLIMALTLQSTRELDAVPAARPAPRDGKGGPGRDLV